MFEFHISREARDLYQVKEVLFSFNGNAVFANPSASRQLAYRMNQVRGAEQVNPGALFAMGLIDEAAHAMMAHYRETVAPSVMEDALLWFSERVGPEELDRLLLAFVERFPGTTVYNGKETAAEWLDGSVDTAAGEMSHRAVIFEELLLLWFANQNPAFRPFKELFDDTPLKEATVYAEVTQQLPDYFATQPPLGPEELGLLQLLTSVFGEGEGGTLSDQLSRLRARWGFAVGDLLRRVLLAGDVLKEEEVALWLQYNPPSAEALARRNRGDGFSKGGAEVPNFSTSPVEYEAFSPDQEWMPRTVMIAKSTYVWLHQLSRAYGRDIRTLDQIPDQELETLAARGMNALWLIGVWERSRASQTIKRLCGNETAVASAYSLYDYSIAHNLGGEPAYRDLRDRASRYGLRLASDMVPNHMGIDSTWVIEHPEWFLSRPDSPYPAYSFEGPDLSGNDRVEIKIEDHYYQQTDAAVVFRRRDKWSGHIEYVYHGNDGTSFPWNDTAQLNYRSAMVREQVMQTILHVARLFPIIRFDAAMTLAKVHIQRLWFPTPGSGGSIPSRAEHAMTTEEFDAALPNEFWREVVDRVAVEVPGTLLLAEAFWLMEGYFVRTLGMHRVYNSAFMVMLRDEDNAKYREVLKKTLEFDPGIMKRYVNFMSNPDERTAIDQFGSGDKYFGVASMMATLPGLPMFGHGQVEGFTEKYGMEYYRPRYDESPAGNLVDRHHREIAPLLHNRALFAESENFLLYDLWKDDGTVDENVFAYSNRRGDQRALIVYHNAFAETRGTIHRSAAYMDKASGSLRQQELKEALALPDDPNRIFAYRENKSGLTFLRRSADMVRHGIEVHLAAYSYAVLIDWRELTVDAEHGWDKLCDVLQGRGVDDLEGALVSLELAPLHDALRHALTPSLVRRLAALAEEVEAPRSLKPIAAGVALVPDSPVVDEFLTTGVAFLEQARAAYHARLAPAAVTGLPADEGDAVEQASPSVVESPGVEAPGLADVVSPAESRSTSTVADKAAASVPGVEHVVEAPRATPAGAERIEAELVDAEAQNQAALLATKLRERLHALLTLPQVESAFSTPWPIAARSILPSRSPIHNAGAIWAPALAWALFATLGESLDQANPGAPVLAAFDHFRLRHVLAEAFNALNFSGEDTWRAAARVRLAVVAPSTLESADDTSAVPGFPPQVWAEGDVRWLTGVHDSGGATYFNKESYEQLLWWRALPALATVAKGTAPDATAVTQIEQSLMAAARAAERAGYRLTPAPAVSQGTELETATERDNAQAPSASAAAEIGSGSAEPLTGAERGLAATLNDRTAARESVLESEERAAPTSEIADLPSMAEIEPFPDEPDVATFTGGRKNK